MVSASISLLLYFILTGVSGCMSLKLVCLNSEEVNVLTVFVQTVMKDRELLVFSALNLALVPRSWLNWQGRCCAHSLLFTAKSQLRYLFSHQGADIPPFNQMLLPLKEDTKTHLHFHFDDLDS